MLRRSLISRLDHVRLLFSWYSKFLSLSDSRRACSLMCDGVTRPPLRSLDEEGEKGKEKGGLPLPFRRNRRYIIYLHCFRCVFSAASNSFQYSASSSV